MAAPLWISARLVALHVYFCSFFFLLSSNPSKEAKKFALVCLPFCWFSATFSRFSSCIPPVRSLRRAVSCNRRNRHRLGRSEKSAGGGNLLRHTKGSSAVRLSTYFSLSESAVKTANVHKKAPAGCNCKNFHPTYPSGQTTVDWRSLLGTGSPLHSPHRVQNKQRPHSTNRPTTRRKKRWE